jgi:hypothetical protein
MSLYRAAAAAHIQISDTIHKNAPVKQCNFACTKKIRFVKILEMNQPQLTAQVLGSIDLKWTHKIAFLKKVDFKAFKHMIYGNMIFLKGQVNRQSARGTALLDNVKMIQQAAFKLNMAFVI